MRSGMRMRAFFRALAVPMTTSIVLVVSALFFGFRNPVVALLANLLVLFEVAGLSQAFAMPMPAAWFRPRHFERARIYESVGVRVFKRLMRSAIYRRINPDFQLVGGRRGLVELSETMRSAEAAHVLAFAAVAAVTTGAVALGWFDAAGWLTLFNVLFNGYPVMLQRYHRLKHPFLTTS